MRKPRHKFSDSQFIEAVANNKSCAGVLKYLGLIPAGGNYETASKIIKRLNLSTSHFTGMGWRKNSTTPIVPRLTLNEVLVENRYTNSYSLKLRLFEVGIKQKICEKCNLTEWNNEPIPLELDHINGVRTDNRLENLRVICPNCHAQTPTYRSKNRKNLSPNKTIVTKKIRPPKPQKKKCLDCPKLCSPNAVRCKSCSGRYKPQAAPKIKWPSVSWILTRLATDSNYSALGRELGVTDNAIRKHINNYKPPTTGTAC